MTTASKPGRVGDAWWSEPSPDIGEPADIPRDDYSYTGEPLSSSPLSLDYYREKAREFQTTLNALDSAWLATVEAFQLPINDQARRDLQQKLVEFESKKWSLRATAEAINLGAQAINSMGGRFPMLSLPQTLGIPFALPAAVVAAVATAATLIVWGRDWIAGTLAIQQQALAYAELDAPAGSAPEVVARSLELKAQLAQTVQKTEAAKRTADSSGFAALAPLLKWGGFALLAFFAYRAAAPLLKGSGGRRIAAD